MEKTDDDSKEDSDKLDADELKERAEEYER